MLSGFAKIVLGDMIVVAVEKTTPDCILQFRERLYPTATPLLIAEVVRSFLLKSSSVALPGE